MKAFDAGTLLVPPWYWLIVQPPWNVTHVVQSGGSGQGAYGEGITGGMQHAERRPGPGGA